MTTHLEVPEWRGEIPTPEIKVYISGPMRGVPQFGFPMFDRARDWLTKMGYTVFSPADNDRETYPGIEDWPGFAEGQLAPGFHFDLHKAMAWDLARCAEVDALVLLPGWQQSKGAAHEVYVARVCGKRLYEFHPGAVYDEMVELVPPRIIGLSGYARSGKDTAAQALIDRGWERVAFADALKNVYHDTVPEADSRPKEENRPGYQALGESMRENAGDSVWVDAAFRNVQPGGRYVLTDVRYRNEAEKIKELGGEVWRIERPGTGPANAHVSETQLDDWPFDERIWNDGSIADLHAKIARLAIG